MIPLSTIKELAKEQGYGINCYQAATGEAPRIVLIGEVHAAYLHYQFQGTLIQLLKPEVVMHEFYEDGKISSSSETVRTAVEWIRRWPEQYGVTLKPCDLSYRKIKQFQSGIYRFLRQQSELADESDLDSMIVDDNSIRELIMGKLIRSEASRTEKPLVAIVGGYHVRPESLIHQELRCRRPIEIGARKPFSYITINQDEYLVSRLENGAKFFS